jgi:hypothetical protein
LLDLLDQLGGLVAQLVAVNLELEGLAEEPLGLLAQDGLDGFLARELGVLLLHGDAHRPFDFGGARFRVGREGVVDQHGAGGVGLPVEVLEIPGPD